MKLPNAEGALVNLDKLVGYCLNPDHPRGRHKARVFASAAGLTADHAEALHQALLAAVRNEDALLTDQDFFGQRFVLEFKVRGPKAEVRVRSSWIVRQGEDFARFVSCYVV